MFRQLRIIITRWRFERAFAAEFRREAEMRAKHGRVRDAQAAKSRAVHAALRQGLAR